MLLFLPALLGCRNLGCGDFSFEGDIPITYVDNDKGEMPIAGAFRNRCTQRRDPAELSPPIGMDATIHFDPSISSTGGDTLFFDIDVAHRNGAVDWNVARGWFVEVEVPLERVRAGETVSLGDGLVGAAAYWYLIASAGDVLVGPEDDLGFVSHYMPGPTSGEVSFSRVRAKGDDVCVSAGSNWIEIRATWDLAFGEEGVSESWATATGEDWFEADESLACAGLLPVED